MPWSCPVRDQMIREGLNVIGTSLRAADELERALRVFKGLQLARKAVDHACQGCGVAMCDKREGIHGRD